MGIPSGLTQLATEREAGVLIVVGIEIWHAFEWILSFTWT